ncbi:leucine-rich repeat-containing protein 45 isoform X1 [Echeneis naucrates]|uniref:Leucine rich repeat containing 45 n=2 Tax=Echeneis naucrates TaxID=173247 RepID=A0A665XBI1_ECHNA|nr:leucine-rich repeat-containing protein 45 isoform X1 [Echeneis naucrates]XP_029383459.1 leucine-rich repeat-containing protein 45 isoform X1 [Echeneis naucrates]
MEDFWKTYLRMCEEGGVEPQESVVVHLQETTAGQCSRLDLSGQSLSVETCSVLARAFQKETIFTEVLLSDCMLSEEGAKILLTGLLGNNTVKILDMKGNNLKSSGAEALGKLLAHNKAVRRMVLEWNALGLWDDTFSLFCDGLASNSILTQLDLRNNQINHHGASELALALKCNTVLEVLDLRWNNIGLLGGRSLLEALQKNKSIVQLEMAGNNIPSDILKALEQTTGHNLERQSTLRESRNKTQVLRMEIQTLKDLKGSQILKLMEIIDRQRDEIGHSNRSALIQIRQLQEALNERKSTVNSITAKLQMTEAALALSEQKNDNMGELLTRVRAETEEHKEQHNKERKKDEEEYACREGKLLREIQDQHQTTVQLQLKLEEMERRCKSQQQQIFDLKHELTNSTAEFKLRLVQTEERLETEKQRSKQALDDMDGLRQKEVEHVKHHLEESERVLQERIFKLEGQRIQLEEELSKAKAACVTERSQAEEELGRVRAQAHLEVQEHISSMEEKVRSARSSLQEVQLQCSQQRQTIYELQSKTSQQSTKMDGLRRRIEELQQELLGKDQEKVAEVSKVRVEFLEQIGHLQAERTAQTGLKEKINALERELKVLTSNHREVLLDKEHEMLSMHEKLRHKEAEILRMREDAANRASYLQSAILTYVQGSPVGHYDIPKK